MQKNIQTICDNVIARYKRDKNVLGILLFGSAARNKFDQYSDVDIYILLRKKGKFSRSNFTKNGTRVDVILNTMEEAKAYLKKDRNNLRRITSHMLAYSKILFAREKSLSRIQAIAKNNLELKTEYTKNEILMHKYSIDDFWGEISRDIENKDYLAFGIDSQLLVNNILELFFKLHGEFLQQPNEMTKALTKLDKKFANHTKNFYRESDIQKKKKILAELIKYIYSKSGGSLPKRWSLKD